MTETALMGWAAFAGGIDWETFAGPFVYFLGFGRYLVPLVVLEMFFRVHDRREPASQIALAIAIAALTLYLSFSDVQEYSGMRSAISEGLLKVTDDVRTAEQAILNVGDSGNRQDAITIPCLRESA